LFKTSLKQYVVKMCLKNSFKTMFNDDCSNVVHAFHRLTQLGHHCWTRVADLVKQATVPPSAYRSSLVEQAIPHGSRACQTSIANPRPSHCAIDIVLIWRHNVCQVTAPNYVTRRRRWPFYYCSCIPLVAGHPKMSHNVEGGYIY